MKLSDGSTHRCRQGACLRSAGGRTSPASGWRPLGVKLADNGGIAVDEFSRTSVPHIYAVGDVTNRINLTPVAIREGHAFADTRVRRQADARVDHADVPTAVFSEPEVGAIGLTEGERAREVSARRHLQGDVPSAEGDAVRPRRRACC